MQLRGNLYLLMAAFIWGTTFVAQMMGMGELGPYSYAAARYILGFLSLVVVWLGFKQHRERQKVLGLYQPGWMAGLGAGGIMFFATTLQQVAMTMTSASKTAFITALYIVLVPFGAVLLGKRVHRENWVGAVLALIGLYMLSFSHGAGEPLNFGDLLLIISAFFWAAQILFVDRFASAVDAIELSVAQLFVCMAGSILMMVFFEYPVLSAFMHSWFSIFYGGVMSAGVAFTLQIFGQKYAEPGPAAVIMSFEAVFGAVSSALLLGERLTLMEMTGCVLMLCGMLVTQIGLFTRKRTCP